MTGRRTRTPYTQSLRQRMESCQVGYYVDYQGYSEAAMYAMRAKLKPKRFKVLRQARMLYRMPDKSVLTHATAPKWFCPLHTLAQTALTCLLTWRRGRTRWTTGTGETPRMIR